MSREVLVVVVTHNSSVVIDDLLDSLPAALAGTRATTLVVDNASTDDTADRVARRDDCRLVRQANLGYSAGINRGVREADNRGAAVLVLNPDVRLAPGSVSTLLDGLRHPHVGIVAPRMLDEQGRLVQSLRREPTLARAIGFGGTESPFLSEYVTDSATYDSPQVVDWAVGAVMLVARACHDDLGGWDESFFLYSEETDFCLRARDKGWLTRYEPLAVVNHIGGGSGQSPRIHAMQIVNRVRLYRRRHGAAAGAAYYVLSLLSELSWILRGHRQSFTSVRA